MISFRAKEGGATSMSITMAIAKGVLSLVGVFVTIVLAFEIVWRQVETRSTLDSLLLTNYLPYVRFKSTPMPQESGSPHFQKVDISVDSCLASMPQTGVGLQYALSGLDDSWGLSPFLSPDNYRQDVAAKVEDCLGRQGLLVQTAPCTGKNCEDYKQPPPDVADWRGKIDCPSLIARAALAPNGTLVEDIPITHILYENQTFPANFADPTDGAQVYAFSSDIPVIFWNRTEPGAGYHMYHGTARLFDLFNILLDVGLVDAETGLVNRQNRIVIFDDAVNFRLGMFNIHMLSMTAYRPIYREFYGTGYIGEEQIPFRRRSLVVCAPNAVVAKRSSKINIFHSSQWKTLMTEQDYPNEARRLWHFTSNVVAESALKYPDMFVPLVPRFNKPKAPRILFLVRKAHPSGAKKRVILNEAELRKNLKPPSGCGDIEWVSFEGIPFTEQLEQMLNTTIIISLHGSGLSNTIYMPRGSTVVELYPDLWGGQKLQILGNMARLTGKHHILHEYKVDHSLRGDEEKIMTFNPTLDAGEIQGLIEQACNQGINKEFLAKQQLHDLDE